ncbi:MAG: response regulator [Planctomycetota bacterium]
MNVTNTPSISALSQAETTVTEQQPARVLVLDDDPGVLSAIGQVLHAHGFAAEIFSSPAALLDSVHVDDIGCLVTDLEMPQINGIEVQTRLLAAGSCLAVVVVTAHADVPRTIKIMSQGAVTLLEKPFKSQQLITAVKNAVEISRRSFERKSRIENAQTLIDKLSDEELQIMKLAAAGMPNKAISLQLDLSPRTIDRRRQSALQKLDVASVADFAVMYATSQQELS